jgi:hypothetical protein
MTTTFRVQRRPYAALMTAGLMVLLVAARAQAQAPPAAATPSGTPAAQAPAAPPEPEAMDLLDLARKLRHKEPAGAEQNSAEQPARMSAFAPVIGYKPTSGGMIGVAGNVALFLGKPATTHISSFVTGATFSSKKQTSITARFTVFGRDDRWALDGDNRAQWTSQDTFGLGTITTPDARLNMKFDYFRIYDVAYVETRRYLYVGLGFHYSAHTNVEPGQDADAAWNDSPYVAYSRTHAFPLDSQTSAGASANLRVDTRDSAINPDRGWLAGVSYRPFFKDFLSGDSSWQELYLDLRTYRGLSADRRQKLAFWLWGDLVTGGVAPYMDLPATGMDRYGRSGRGYGEGRFRGERLLYGEVEYRATLTRNRLLGMVVFVNTTTLSNRETGERLFDNAAPGAGAGLRLLLNKRSNTNLCVDVGFGKYGSRGFYLAVEEAF